MNIIIENNDIKIQTQRGLATLPIQHTKEVKKAIEVIYQAGRDKEQLNFQTSIETTNLVGVTEETN